MAQDTKLEVKSGKKAQPATKQAAPVPASRHWEPFDSLHREIDRLFDSFGKGFWRRPAGIDLERLWPGREGWDLSPAVDVAETDKAYEVSAELPGMDEGDLEVNVANGSLTIKGEKKEEKEQKEKDYHVSERRYGSFQRTFRLPDGVDADKIAATFSKGLLKVTMPKTAAARTSKRKIDVKAG